MSNNPKPGYKLSEIGEIPEDWEVVRLGDVLALCDNGTWGENDATPETGYPILRSTNIKNGKVINLSEVAYRRVLKNRVEKYKLLPGDIIVTRSSGSPHLVGDIAYFDVDKEGSQVFLFSNYTQRLRIEKDKIKSKFLCYYLLSPIAKNILKKIFDTTTGLKNLNIKTYKSQPIPLPPLPEQHKTASILSTVDETIQKTDEVIKKTQELKKGLMQQLLTKGIGHTRFKQTEIGEIPEDWEVVRLGDILTHCEYGLSVRLASSGKYPIFRMNNIENGYVADNDMKYVDLNDRTFNQFRLERGDILFNRTNSYELVGKVGIFLLGGGYTFASYLIRLRTNQLRANPLFINSYLNADWIQFRLKNLATRGVSQSNINATNLKSLKVLLPPLPEQRKIAEILSGVDEKIEAERKKKEKFEELKKGLMQVLLTGKVRVNIVGADPCVCPQ